MTEGTKTRRETSGSPAGTGYRGGGVPLGMGIGASPGGRGIQWRAEGQGRKRPGPQSLFGDSCDV